MEIHLKIINEAGMTKAKMRRIEIVRAKTNGIVIIQGINITTLPRMGRDCQTVVIF